MFNRESSDRREGGRFNSEYFTPLRVGSLAFFGITAGVQINDIVQKQVNYDRVAYLVLCTIAMGIAISYE